MASQFDPSKDKTIRELGRMSSGKMLLVASLCSYDGGPVKVSIHREATKKDGSTYHRPAGRFTLEEASWLSGILKTAQ